MPANKTWLRSSAELQNTPLPERTIGDNYVHAIAIKPLIELLKPGNAITALDPFQEALIANNSDRLRVPEVLPLEAVTCVDELYFIDTSEHNAEFGDDPVVRGHLAWSEVGRHMYFSPVLRKITHAILRKTFGLDEDAKVPTVRLCPSIEWVCYQLIIRGNRQLASTLQCISDEPVSHSGL